MEESGRGERGRWSRKDKQIAASRVRQGPQYKPSDSAQAKLVELKIKGDIRNRIKLDLHTTASAVSTGDVQMGKLSNQRKQKPEM